MFCNRALCHKKLDQDDLYLLNLNESIETNDHYEKPLKLRASYYYSNEKWEESLEDYKTLKEKFGVWEDKLMNQLEKNVANL